MEPCATRLRVCAACALSILRGEQSKRRREPATTRRPSLGDRPLAATRKQHQQPTDASDQLGVQSDGSVENLRDRAVLLGSPCQLEKFGFVQIRHLCPQSESGATDAETLTFRVERDHRLSGEFRRGVPSGLQPERQRHGEAASMGCGDELFWIGTLLVFEPGLKGIRRFGEHTGIGGKIAATGTTGAAPNRFCLPHHLLDPFRVCSNSKLYLAGARRRANVISCWATPAQ